ECMPWRAAIAVTKSLKLPRVLTHPVLYTHGGDLLRSLPPERLVMVGDAQEDVDLFIRKRWTPPPAGQDVRQQPAVQPAPSHLPGCQPGADSYHQEATNKD